MEATEKSQCKEASTTVNQTPVRSYQILAEGFHGQVVHSKANVSTPSGGEDSRSHHAAAYLRISPQV